MEHNQITIAEINHQRAIRIKFLTFSLVVEKIGRCRNGYFGIWGSSVVAVAVVERSEQESIYGLSAGTKRGGSCKKVAISWGSTVCEQSKSNYRKMHKNKSEIILYVKKNNGFYQKNLKEPKFMYFSGNEAFSLSSLHHGSYWSYWKNVRWIEKKAISVDGSAS